MSSSNEPGLVSQLSHRRQCRAEKTWPGSTAVTPPSMSSSKELDLVSQPSHRRHCRAPMNLTWFHCRRSNSRLTAAIVELKSTGPSFTAVTPPSMSSQMNLARPHRHNVYGRHTAVNVEFQRTWPRLTAVTHSAVTPPSMSSCNELGLVSQPSHRR